jgi:hypothetical protein
MKALWQTNRIAIAFLFLFSINALCSSISGALTGMEWGGATGQQRFLVVVSIVGTWTTVLLAFFRDALAKIVRGQNPLLPDTRPPFSPREPEPAPPPVSPTPRTQPPPEAFEKLP